MPITPCSASKSASTRKMPGVTPPLRTIAALPEKTALPSLDATGAFFSGFQHSANVIGVLNSSEKIVRQRTNGP